MLQIVGLHTNASWGSIYDPSSKRTFVTVSFGRSGCLYSGLMGLNFDKFVIFHQKYFDKGPLRRRSASTKVRPTGHHIPRFWKIRQLPAFGWTEGNVDAARTRYWENDRGNTLTAVGQQTVWKINKPLEPFHFLRNLRIGQSADIMACILGELLSSL